MLMARNLLADYARLLTVDTLACVELFAPDAEYRTRLGTYDLSLRGRSEIQRFLSHVPRQISFRSGPAVRDGREYRGEVHVHGEGLQPRTQSVRYSVADGLITRFEILGNSAGPSVATSAAT
jgi:hypothetical protein